MTRLRVEPLRQLTFAQLLELRIGPAHNGSAFVDDTERRAAWGANRADLMGRASLPWAYWTYDGPVETRHDDDWRRLAERRAAHRETLR